MRLFAPALLILHALASIQASAAPATVSVNAAAPNGRLSPYLFGQNWNAYEKSGDSLDMVYNAALRASGARTLRIPGGGYGSMRVWDDITCSGKDAWLLDLNAAIKFAKATGVELQPIINFGGWWCEKAHGHDAAIQKAAAWVKHMNVDPKASPAKYWEIGNEVFYERDKSHTDGKTYGTQFARYAAAMKKADPAIKLGFCLFEDREAKKLAWNSEALKAVKATGVLPDFWVIHSYPIWMPAEARKASGAPDWNKDWYADNPKMDLEILKNVATAEKYTHEVQQTIAEFLSPAAAKLPLWLTEFRSVLELKYIEFVDAIYTAEYLLELGRLGWEGANIWALKNGYSAKNKSDFGLLRTGVDKDPDDNPKSSPRPSYYVYPYLSKVFGPRLVQAVSDHALVKAWASKDAAGNLTVFLANHEPEPKGAVKVKLSLAGFKAAPQAEAWLLESAGTDVHERPLPIQHRRDITINGVLRPDPSRLPAARAVNIAAGIDLPASSMMFLRLKPAK